MRVNAASGEQLVSRGMDNYKMLDIMKYISAIMVICIHCNPLFSNEYLSFFFKSIICRIAVPFFFTASAYFIRKGASKKTGYVNSYLKKAVHSYLGWSVLFIPIGLDWLHQKLTHVDYLLPFALVYALCHIGTYYHLWYIPAILFSVFFVDKLLKRVSYKTLFAVSVSLYVFGSLETYYGLIRHGWFKDFFDTFIKIFFTTRSGLFLGTIFVLIGFFIYDYQEKLKLIVKYVPLLTIIFAILLVMEGNFLFNIDRLNMNFLLMLPPFSLFFFMWMLTIPYVPKFDTKRIRSLSKYYYFVHPICVLIVEQIGRAYRIEVLSQGGISFLLIVLMTHLLSSLIISIQQPLVYSRVLLALLCGVMLTLMLAGLFFNFKSDSVIVDFEFVPSLCIFVSFCMYYLLTMAKRKMT